MFFATMSALWDATSSPKDEDRLRWIGGGLIAWIGRKYHVYDQPDENGVDWRMRATAAETELAIAREQEPEDEGLPKSERARYRRRRAEKKKSQRSVPLSRLRGDVHRDVFGATPYIGPHRACGCVVAYDKQSILLCDAHDHWQETGMRLPDEGVDPEIERDAISELRTGTDPTKWAGEFVRLFEGEVVSWRTTPLTPTLMQAWFSAAIQAGHAAGVEVGRDAGWRSGSSTPQTWSERWANSALTSSASTTSRGSTLPTKEARRNHDGPWRPLRGRGPAPGLDAARAERRVRDARRTEDPAGRIRLREQPCRSTSGSGRRATKPEPDEPHDHGYMGRPRACATCGQEQPAVDQLKEFIAANDPTVSETQRKARELGLKIDFELVTTSPLDEHDDDAPAFEPMTDEAKREYQEGLTKDWDTLESAVYVALGAASACWENLEGAGVFDDQRAVLVAQSLVKWIEQRYYQEPRDERRSAEARGGRRSAGPPARHERCRVQQGGGEPRTRTRRSPAASP